MKKRPPQDDREVQPSAVKDEAVAVTGRRFALRVPGFAVSLHQQLND
jgi:hypothetical protein